MITQEYIRYLFEYHEDGLLIWKVNKAKRTKIGDIAGCYSPCGYYYVGIDDKNYKLHRLIWIYHHGYISENLIDHRDKNPLNNRIENLREISSQCNNRNSKDFITNTSGVKGVSWTSDRSLWYSCITIYGKTISLGRYDDFTEAVCVRLAAEQCLKWDGCDSCSSAFKYLSKLIKIK